MDRHYDLLSGRGVIRKRRIFVAFIAERYLIHTQTHTYPTDVYYVRVTMRCMNLTINYVFTYVVCPQREHNMPYCNHDSLAGNSMIIEIDMVIIKII